MMFTDILGILSILAAIAAIPWVWKQCTVSPQSPNNSNHDLERRVSELEREVASCKRQLAPRDKYGHIPCGRE